MFDPNMCSDTPTRTEQVRAKAASVRWFLTMNNQETQMPQGASEGSAPEESASSSSARMSSPAFVTAIQRSSPESPFSVTNDASRAYVHSTVPTADPAYISIPESRGRGLHRTIPAWVTREREREEAAQAIRYVQDRTVPETPNVDEVDQRIISRRIGGLGHTSVFRSTADAEITAVSWAIADAISDREVDEAMVTVEENAQAMATTDNEAPVPSPRGYFHRQQSEPLGDSNLGLPREYDTSNRCHGCRSCTMPDGTDYITWWLEKHERERAEATQRDEATQRAREYRRTTGIDYNEEFLTAVFSTLGRDGPVLETEVTRMLTVPPQVCLCSYTIQRRMTEIRAQFPGRYTEGVCNYCGLQSTQIDEAVPTHSQRGMQFQARDNQEDSRAASSSAARTSWEPN